MIIINDYRGDGNASAVFVNGEEVDNWIVADDENGVVYAPAPFTAEIDDPVCHRGTVRIELRPDHA